MSPPYGELDGTQSSAGPAGLGDGKVHTKTSLSVYMMARLPSKRNLRLLSADGRTRAGFGYLDWTPWLLARVSSNEDATKRVEA